jgi:hypothetical protein
MVMIQKIGDILPQAKLIEFYPFIQISFGNPNPIVELMGLEPYRQVNVSTTRQRVLVYKLLYLTFENKYASCR